MKCPTLAILSNLVVYLEEFLSLMNWPTPIGNFLFHKMAYRGEFPCLTEWPTSISFRLKNGFPWSVSLFNKMAHLNDFLSWNDLPW